MNTEAEIISQLKKVNGVYICGDSERSVANQKYQDAFDTVMEFVVRTNKEMSEYFPIFMMGKGAHSFIRKLGLSTSDF